MEELAISKFKATCLAVLDEVNRTGEPVLVTKRGVPVAQIVPPPPPPKRKSWLGSMAGTFTMHDDLIEPASRPDEWEALSG
ncbi:MAG: type II toxin-antitoxin system Phd/YefM family antitoxin [Acidimicrobiia bacterium]|jgi:prevent-host-death family protein|nr:type II toxin-antitoxin system Phd/YefM family antitoxin [Acidimicrobiia bacterium]